MTRILPTLCGLAALASALVARPAWSARAQVPQPTSQPQIVVYTMGNGEVLWQKFGHAAICAEYPDEPRFDVCYNYGTTDFGAPITLGWTFVRGESRFWVAPASPRQMVRFYRALDRTLWRQVLPLSVDQARRAADMLATAALPENRFYIYHHFYDNCTTRVRDVIDAVTGGALRTGSAGRPGPTFREYARRGFAEDTWMLVITDLLLGRDSDVQPDGWQVMFLPDYLREAIRTQLGVEPELIYQRTGRPLSDDPGTGGRGWYVLFGLGFALLIGLARLTERLRRLATFPAVIALFLVALPMWFLAVVSSLDALRYNEALLVFWPTDIALLWLSPARRERYAQIRVAGLLLVSLLLAAGVLVQPLHLLVLVPLGPMAALAIPRHVLAAARGRMLGRAQPAGAAAGDRDPDRPGPAGKPGGQARGEPGGQARGKPGGQARGQAGGKTRGKPRARGRR